MSKRTRIKLKWADPETYGGQPVCVRCGQDENGTKWPICADLVARDCPSSVRRAVCALTCAHYWDHGDEWMCAECDRIVGGGSDSMV